MALDARTEPTACSIAVGTHDTTLVTDRTRGWPVDAEGDDAPLPRGARVGRYLVLGELGRGGMGIVYRAYDPELDRPLALKRLRTRGLPPDSPAHARLRREAQTLARLSHPHVVTIYDVGQDDAGLFIAMELVEGEDLAGWIGQGLHPWPAVVERLAAAGHGLAAAHRVGVVHRDFKPANVLLGRDGRVAVTDFGLARPETTPTEAPTGEDRSFHPDAKGPDDSRLTRLGARVGTPAYMAPEQHAGEPPADARADQYAFCIVLYEALYGQRPFSGADVASLAASKRVGVQRWPDDPPRHAVPRRLRRVLARGLQPDPALRFARMEDLLARLDPGARRRTTLAVVTVAVLGTTAVLGASRGEADPCAGSAQALGSAWDADTRDAMATRLGAVALPYAAQAAESTTTKLDAWAEEWTTTHREICEATWRSGQQSAEALDVRMACLHDGRRVFEATVAALGDATPQVVENAAELVLGLPDPNACGGLAPRPEPTAPRLDDAYVARARERVAELEALRRTGRGREALERAETLAREIEAGLDPETSATFHYTLGVLRDDAGDFGGAQASLQRAAALARATGDARREAEAWIELTRIAGTHQHDATEGRFFGELALAAIAAAGGDRTLRSHALLELGEVAFRAGDDATTLVHWTEAEALRREQYGEDDVRVAQVWSRLAGVDLRRGDMEGARARLEAVIERYGEAFGPEHPRMAAPLGNLGLVLSALGDHEAAVAHMRRATAIAASSRGPHHPQVAGGHAAIGHVLVQAGKPAVAEPELEAAIAGFERSLGPEHPAVAEPLLDLGEARLALGRADEAVAPLERALALASAVDVPPVQLADTRFALARALEQREPARAVELARAAFEAYATSLDPRDDRWPQVQAWRRSHPDVPPAAP
jgi:eukaryotic-like serine/threonine-protein kinase